MKDLDWALKVQTLQSENAELRKRNTWLAGVSFSTSAPHAELQATNKWLERERVRLDTLRGELAFQRDEARAEVRRLMKERDEWQKKYYDTMGSEDA